MWLQQRSQREEHNGAEGSRHGGSATFVALHSHFDNDKSLHKVRDAMPFNGVYNSVRSASCGEDEHRDAVCPSKLMIL